MCGSAADDPSQHDAVTEPLDDWRLTKASIEYNGDGAYSAHVLLRNETLPLGKRTREGFAFGIPTPEAALQDAIAEANDNALVSKG